MLSMRLSRVGKKNQPTFRLIVVDSHKDPWGKAVEILGNRNPRSKELTLNAERVSYWLSKGAQPSNTVRNLLVDQKLIEGKKHNVTHLSKKRRGKIDEKKAKETPAAAASAEAPPAA